MWLLRWRLLRRARDAQSAREYVDAHTLAKSPPGIRKKYSQLMGAAWKIEHDR